MSQTLHLEAARTRVSIAPERGGRVAQIEALHRGTWVSLLHEPIETPPQQRDPMTWGSFVMVPWPNRIARARFSWRDALVELPSNFGDHAIHGLCFDRPWDVAAVTPTACSLRVEFGPRWPFGGYARQRIEVLDDGLAQTIEVHADGAPFPAGAGWHPWFRRDVGGAQHVHAQVDAPERYELANGIPTGRLVPVEGEHDLRDYPALRERRLDDCYRCTSGTLRLRWDDLELWIESSDNVRHAIVYTPAHAICLEPQTCAVDAFNLAAKGGVGTGAVTVEPGMPLVASTVWRWASSEPQWQQVHAPATDA
jgi:aldose 1-epimerase